MMTTTARPAGDAVRAAVTGSQTAQEMYDLLHEKVSDFRPDYMFIPRRIPLAFRTLQEWEEQGIVESRTDDRGTITYRLTPAGCDPALAAVSIHEHRATLLRRKAHEEQCLQDATTQMHKTWGEVQATATRAAALGDTPRPEQIGSVAETLTTCGRRMSGAVYTHHRSAKELAGICQGLDDLETFAAALAERAPEPAADDDPLGGDA